MKNRNLKLSAVVAAIAMLVPAGAVAKRPDDRPKDKPKKAKTQREKAVTANVKGTVVASDGSTLTVMVEKASGQAKACKGRELTFDVTGAKVKTADNDADGDMDAADVLVEHVVKVRGKVTVSKGRKTTCSVGEEDVVPARAVHNRTTPKPEDEVEETEVEELEEELEA